MSPSTTATPGAEIPRWPKISVTLNADGTGLLTNQGRDHRLNAPNIDAARADVLQRVMATATSLERPVRLNSTDPDGEWELAVHPDGTVVELAGKPVSQPTVTRVTPAPLDVGVPAEPTSLGLTRSQRRWAGEPRERRTGRPAVRIGVALALLMCLGAAAALVVTNGPATVVKSPTPPPPPPAPPAISPDASAAASDAAAAKARQRRATRRAAAARERRQRAALIRRVNERKARERRAARRRAATRRATIARRAARVARRRPAAATPPPAAPRPRQPAVRPPPAPPPPPPAAPPCGEFDLC